LQGTDENFGDLDEEEEEEEEEEDEEILSLLLCIESTTPDLQPSSA